MSKAALLIIAKTCKQPKCPLTDKWIKKMWYMLLSHKKTNELMPFAAKWIQPDMIILSQTDKSKYHKESLICGIYSMTQRTSQVAQW